MNCMEMIAIQTPPSSRRPALGSMDFGLFSRYRIPILPYALAHDVSSASASAKKIGYPIALKLVSSRFLHKSDSGALALNVRDESVLRQEYARLVALARGDKAVSILVQAYRPGRFELIIGGRTDPQFGPVLMLGLGGIYTEVLRDTALRVCPIDEAEARSMIRSLRAYPILSGARGRKAIDEDALVRLLLNVARLMENEKPSELDINPVLVRNDGIWAADARVLR